MIDPRACVGSGYCCKKAPCPFGKWDPELQQCTYLVVWDQSETKTERYRCGIFAHIAGQPGANLSPAFGAGCCSPLFNERRDAVLVELRRKESA